MVDTVDIQTLINEYEGDRVKEIRGVFSSISILQNRLQTIFDKSDTQITLKQFMVLAMIRHAKHAPSYTQLGELLGSSRQNIKKLVTLLEKNGFVEVKPGKGNMVSIHLTDVASSYFGKVYDEHSIILERIFSVYSDEEIHTFYLLITKLYDGVKQEESRMNQK